MTDKKTEGERLEDLMNKTDTEMQRLGWTVDQGREHLIKCCGKRSRSLLTGEELDNFLLYLQLTDSPDPTPQSQS